MFYYFAVKVLARAAGYEEEKEQRIAAYSQFIDDFNYYAYRICGDIPDYLYDKKYFLFFFKQFLHFQNYSSANTRKAIKKNLKTEIGGEAGIFTVSFTDINPVFAKDVVNYAVKLLESCFTELTVDQNIVTKANLEENIELTMDTIDSIQQRISEIESSVSNIYNPYAASSIVKDTAMLKLELEAQKENYKQLKAQLEVTKVELASEKTIFQILEYAEVSVIKSVSGRDKICVIITFVSFFLSIFMAFLLNAIKNIRKEPVAMRKLKGKK